MSINLTSYFKLLPKKVKIIRNNDKVLKYFNYKKYTDVNTICNNLLSQDSDCLYYALEIFSKNHYEYRDMLYKNLENVKIIMQKSKERQGSYNLRASTNIIEFESKRSAYHETLHMASSCYDSETDILFSGFSYTSKKEEIGVGITEGYVELLCDRDERNGRSIPRIYDDGTYIVEYEYVKQLARQLEIIIGKEKLEKIFFTSGYNGLIDEFKKLGKSEKEILKFFKNCDIAVLNEGYSIKPFEKRTLEAQRFLYDICLEKFPEKKEKFEYEKLYKSNESRSLICDRYYDEFNERIEKNDDIIKR